MQASKLPMQGIQNKMKQKNKQKEIEEILAEIGMNQAIKRAREALLT